MHGSLPHRVDFCGTGCLLFWRELCPPVFESHARGIPAHDWAWGTTLTTSGGRLEVLPDVRCRHYQSETEYV
jgi:hypothetical protein